MSRWTRLMLAGVALLCGCAAALADNPPLSVCSPITVAAVHRLSPTDEDPFPVYQRLALIENETVPCMHWDGFEATRCTFRADPADSRGNVSGHWLEDKQGRRFARVGQSLAKDGTRGGPYIIGAQLAGNTVPCVGASGHDTAGTAVGIELGGACVIETLNATYNVTGLPLKNYATIPICTSSFPHPDGAKLQRANRAAGVYCYIGEGAGLNDPSATERDSRGVYLWGTRHCHIMWQSGFEYPAAKRPAVKGFPKRVDVTTPILWRPMVSGIKIAN